MFKTVTFLFIIIVNSVISNDVTLNEREKRINNHAIESYRYNHPPLFGTYDIISEVDEIEGQKTRKEKSIHLEENLPTFQTPVGANKNGTVVKRRKLRRRQQSLNKEDIKATTQSELISRQNEEKVALRKIPVTKEIVPVTERFTLSTSPRPRTVVPTVFTKRPPEFNPVFKKNVRQPEPVVKILEETNFVYSHNGNFHYSYEGGDGTKISSEGLLKSFKNDKTGEAVSGNVFYTDKDGNDFNLSYTADENGYRPHGAHLPTPPPIPPAIARALKYLETKPTEEPVTEVIKKIRKLDNKHA